jgi:Transposase DDE domain
MHCKTGCPKAIWAYFISDTVDSRDLSAFDARYAGGGHRTIGDFRALHLAEFTELDIPAEIQLKQARLQTIETAKQRLEERRRLKTAQTQTDYRQRKWLAEPPNYWIKNMLGFRHFSMRGLEKTQADFKCVRMAVNLRRMGAMQMGYGKKGTPQLIFDS